MFSSRTRLPATQTYQGDQVHMYSDTGHPSGVGDLRLCARARTSLKRVAVVASVRCEAVGFKGIKPWGSCPRVNLSNSRTGAAAQRWRGLPCGTRALAGVVRPTCCNLRPGPGRFEGLFVFPALPRVGGNLLQACVQAGASASARPWLCVQNVWSTKALCRALWPVGPQPGIHLLRAHDQNRATQCDTPAAAAVRHACRMASLVGCLSRCARGTS